MPLRASDHIRQNVVGYVALFCFAVGGTATALPGRESVETDDLQRKAVRTSKLADHAVTGRKLRDAAVGGAKIAAGSITADHIAADSVRSSQIADDSVTGADVDESTLDLPLAAEIPATLPPSGPAGGDLQGSYPDPGVREEGLATGGDLSGPLSSAQVDEAMLAAGGDVSGTLASTQVAESGLTTGGDLNGPLSAADVLESQLGAGGDLSGSLADAQVDPAGVAAGGDVTGPLNATNIATGAVGSGEIADRLRSIVVPASAIQLGFVPSIEPQRVGAGLAAPALAFDPDDVKYVLVTFGVPEDRVPGTNLQVVLHTSVPATSPPPSNRVVWEIFQLTYGASGGTVTGSASFAGDEEVAYSSSNRIAVAGPISLGSSFTNGDLVTVLAERGADLPEDDLAQDGHLHAVELRYTAER
jgi:hypothetical protein